MTRDNWPRTHEGAKAQQAIAQDLLDAVKSGKRQAANIAAGSNDATYAKKSADAKAGRWPDGMGFDAVWGSKRTTT